MGGFFKKKKEETKKSLAVVVSAGGLKPLATVSFFKFLEQYNIEPDLVVSCSGGCLTSGLWATGHSADEMIEKVDFFREYLHGKNGLAKLNYKTILGVGNYPFGTNDMTQGIVHGDMLLEVYHEGFGEKNIEDLDRKLIVQTTDLNTGEGVVIETGNISDAVYASAALYPVLPPIRIDNRWLVDGAYHSATPIIEAVKRNYDNIIVLNFSEPKKKSYDNFLDFYLTFVSTALVQRTRYQTPFALNMHHGEMLFVEFAFEEVFSIWDLKEVQRIYEFGDRVMSQNEDEILQMVGR